MAIRKITATIPSGAAVSEWVSAASLADNGTLAIVGIATPGTVDAVTLAVEFSIDGSTALQVTTSAGAAVTITQAANTYISIAPSSFPVVPGFVRIKSSGNVAANRDYTLVFRDVV